MPPDIQPSPAPQPTTKRRWPLHLHHRGSWLVIGLVVLVLGLASYVGLHSRTKPATTQAYLAQVSITNTGFSPSILSVKPGTQVSWTNTDSQPHQVAADPYPKNNSIAGFNSTQLLQTNDSYSFTFTNKGTYTYHDQLNPLKLRGSVVVR